ncbi:hypothetical protein ACEQ8H_003187 [Pleosporales sp. CAS-2024a]
MRSPSFLPATLLLATTYTPTLASPVTTVHNNCTFAIYYAPVDSSGPPKNMIQVPAGAFVFQDEYFDGHSGTALKITKSSTGLYTGAPVLNFGYTLKDGETWWSLTPVLGYDFWGHNVTLVGDRVGSEAMVWLGEPGPVRIGHWFGEIGLTLTLCAGRLGLGLGGGV